MFSLLLTNAHLMRIEMVSAFFGALCLGVHHVGMYTPGISNFMAVLQYMGGDPDNFHHAAIGCGVSFAAGFALTATMQVRKGRGPAQCPAD